MKNRDLINKLKQYNLDAEVGYEHQVISYVHGDGNGEYIDLGWCGKLYPEKNLNDTGVYVLTATYTALEDTEEGSATTVTKSEIFGLYSTFKKADESGKALLKHGQEIFNVMYKDYKVELKLVW